MLTVRDARDKLTVNEYDTAGNNLRSTKDPLDNLTTYQYSIVNGQRTRMKDALDRETKYDYDAAGRLSTQTDPLGNITVEERQLLLPDLLSIACFNHGLTEAARDIVLALPHQWLIHHIEEAAEPLLQFNNYEEYQGLFQIYTELDIELARKLAQRAANHSDVDIQDAADHFFEALRQKGKP